MFVDGAMLAHQNGRFAALRAGRSILASTPPSEPRLFAWGLLVERLDFTDVLNAIQVTCMWYHANNGDVKASSSRCFSDTIVSL